MGEVKREPHELYVGAAEKITIFDEDHTISDIARWLIKNNYQDEIVYFLTDGKESLLG